MAPLQKPVRIQASQSSAQASILSSDSNEEIIFSHTGPVADSVSGSYYVTSSFTVNQIIINAVPGDSDTYVSLYVNNSVVQTYICVSNLGFLLVNNLTINVPNGAFVKIGLQSIAGCGGSNPQSDIVIQLRGM